MHAGNPFRTTLARDVMTPLTLTLRLTDTLADALALFAQSKLEWLAVLDDRGRFVGMLDRTKVADVETASPRAAQPVENWMSRDVPQLDATAPFAELMDKFVREEEPVLAVACAGRPLGFIAHEQFLALVRPVSLDMFADETDRDASGSDYLVVPDAAFA
jgi:predicted transcriptional regulator